MSIKGEVIEFQIKRLASNRASLTRRPFPAGPCSVSNCAALPLLSGIPGSLSLQCRRPQVGRRACEVHRQSRMQNHAGLFHRTPSGERDPRPLEISVAGRHALPTGSNAKSKSGLRQSIGPMLGRPPGRKQFEAGLVRGPTCDGVQEIPALRRKHPGGTDDKMTSAGFTDRDFPGQLARAVDRQGSGGVVFTPRAIPDPSKTQSVEK